MRIREWTATMRGIEALRRVLVTSAVCGVVVAGAEGSAYALQGGEDPALLPVLLDKRYGADGKQKASIMFTTSVITKLVEDVGFVATYQYNLFDFLGVGLTAGYFLGSETNIATAIRMEAADPSCDPAAVPDCSPLGDLYQMQWLASADVMFVPLYGKISFASEFNPSFELYLIAGVGAGGVRRQNSAGGNDSAVTVVGNLGLGMRFHILDWIGVRAEFRDYFYPEPAAGVSGMTWNPHMQFGAEFTFGGDN